MKHIDEYKTTNNNQLFKKLRKSYLEGREIFCSRCPYHKFENFKSWNKTCGAPTSWKKQRKTQYKPK